MIQFSDLYIKRVLGPKATYKSVKADLKEYADIMDVDPDETLYYFVVRIIKSRDFFTEEEHRKEMSEELLFDAIYWASKVETKKKTRPQNASKIKEGRTKNLYTSLQHELIKGVYDVHSSQIKRDIDLTRYLQFFFDLYGVKRDRRKKQPMKGARDV